MALKQRHKTGKKGDKRHNDGLNTKTDMAYYVKCEMTEFEIQTRDICTLAPPPPLQLEGLFCQLGLLYIYKKLISLKFETGSYFLKSTKKTLKTWANEITHYNTCMFCSEGGFQIHMVSCDQYFFLWSVLHKY